MSCVSGKHNLSCLLEDMESCCFWSWLDWPVVDLFCVIHMKCFEQMGWAELIMAVWGTTKLIEEVMQGKTHAACSCTRCLFLKICFMTPRVDAVSIVVFACTCQQQRTVMICNSTPNVLLHLKKTKHLFYFTTDWALQPGKHFTHTDTDKSKWSCDSSGYPGVAR